MQLDENEVHIWVAPLTLPDQQQPWLALLSPDERERVNRLLSPLHQQRFIAAHAMLRMILGHYLNVSPESLQFKYNNQRKPSLATPCAANLQFNLSHSEDLVVYALTRSQEIGIDIEKIRLDKKSDVAERFFSTSEKSGLAALPPAEQAAGFYRLWSRKEAIIKANGKGFSQPLSSFSVSVEDQQEALLVEGKSWTLLPLAIHPGFAAALAVAEPISSLSIWDFIDQKPIFRSSINLAS